MGYKILRFKLFMGCLSLLFFVMILMASVFILRRERNMKYFIKNALALNDDQYNQINKIQTVDDYNLEITLKVKPQYCPICNQETTRIKGYNKRKISHSILMKRDTTIFYNCRRYLCKHCNASFSESNPFTMKEQTKISSYTIINILEDLKPYNATFSDVARRYNLSVTKVVNIFDSYVQIARKPLTRYLCIDEFYFNRHSKYKYAFMIMDFEKKVILDILESRHYSYLSDYFYKISREERESVDYICIDMYKNYKEIAKDFFKKATVCVDSFHVIKYINDSLNQVRKRIMRRYKENTDSIEYKLLKYRYKLLLKNNEDIDTNEYYYDRVLRYHITEQKILEEILKIDSDLRIAYKLRETYSQFNNITGDEFKKETIEEDFITIMEAFRECAIDEFKKCSVTLRSWKKEILNSFVWIQGRRLSNGPIEGKNNYLKKIINNANGLKNFPRARNRFLYSQNMYEKYSLSKHKMIIKKVGEKRGKYKKAVKS